VSSKVESLNTGLLEISPLTSVQHWPRDCATSKRAPRKRVPSATARAPSRQRRTESLRALRTTAHQHVRRLSLIAWSWLRSPN